MRRAAPVRVYHNAHAGRQGSDGSERLAEQLRDGGIAAEVRPVEPARLGAELRRAREGGTAVVAVAGGDGSLLTAAGVLAGGDTALAPIPTGTLNHFARRLGTEDVPAAVEALAGGRTEVVALGVVDDHVFLNSATFGVYADVVRRRERLRRWLSKWPAAAVAFLIPMLHPRRLDVKLVADGVLLHRRTPLVWVGVGSGSFPRVTEATRREPTLEIVVVRSNRYLGDARLLLRVAWHLLRRERPGPDDDFEIFHAQSLLVLSTHRIGVTLDGEALRLESPLFVTVQDGALKVVVR